MPYASRAKCFVPLFLSLALLGGCSQLRVPGAAGDPFVAYLPAERAGLADMRQAFAAEFNRELSAAGGEPDAARWLHNVAGAPSPDTTPLVPAVPGASSASVLIIPGIFGDCVANQSVPFGDGVSRQTPANYTQAHGRYGPLGFASMRVAQVSGRASTATNARRIAQEIELEARRPEISTIIVVAYSKGTPDTMEALELLRARGALPSKLKAFLSVAGVVMGTLIADEFETLHNALAARVTPLECSPSEGAEVTSLTHRERLLWLAAHPLPGGVKLFSVVAHTSPDRVAPGLKLFHAKLSEVDPRNDGQVIASWAVLPGSTLLAEAKSDHWRFVLPMDKHPNVLVRNLASRDEFPREQFFSALLRTLMKSVAPPARP